MEALGEYLGTSLTAEQREGGREVELGQGPAGKE